MANIFLKNIPEQIYWEIKRRAERSHRSIQDEIIHCLELIVAPAVEKPEMELEKVRRMRKRIKGFLTPAILREMKSAGRT